MNKKRFLSMIIVMALLLSGCASGNKDIIDKTINNFTSKGYTGRLPNTEGNIKAQKYLIKELEKMQIPSYGETYEDQFTYKYVNILKTQLLLDGKELKNGEDYTIRQIRNKELYKDNQVSKEFLLVKSYDEIAKNQGNQSYILEVTELKPFFARTSIIKEDNILDVTKETFEKIKKSQGSIEYTMDYEILETQENNIIGIIESTNGKDRSKKEAIVISAHFDHLGTLGKDWYQGAVDNASGVAGILEISKQIKKQIEEEKQNKDIIIAFFNAEENGMQGSKAFAKKVEAEYKDIININIDCIGIKDIKEINIDSGIISNNKIRDLTESIQKEISKIMILEDKSSASDHINFTNGIGISMDTEDGIANTIGDVKEGIDLENIREIANVMSRLIIENSYLELETVKVIENDKTRQFEFIIEEEKLKFGEYRFVDFQGSPIYIEQSYWDGYYANLEKPMLESISAVIPKDILAQMDKEKTHVNIGIVREEQLYNDSYEINKIYKKDFDIKNLSNIGMRFKIKEEQIRIIMNAERKKDSIVSMIGYWEEELETNHETTTTRVYENYECNIIRKQEEESPAITVGIVDTSDKEMDFFYRIMWLDTEQKVKFTDDEIFKSIEEFQLIPLFENLKERLDG